MRHQHLIDPYACARLQRRYQVLEDFVRILIAPIVKDSTKEVNIRIFDGLLSKEVANHGFGINVTSRRRIAMALTVPQNLCGLLPLLASTSCLGESFLVSPQPQIWYYGGASPD